MRCRHPARSRSRASSSGSRSRAVSTARGASSWPTGTPRFRWSTSRRETEWLTKLYPIGARLVVSGDVEWFDMRPQIRHPDYVLPPERAAEMPALEPVYRLTAGLSPKISTTRHRRRRSTAFPSCPNGFRRTSSRRAAGPSFATRSTLGPSSRKIEEARARREPAWQRLAFDELLASQLALALVRGSLKRGRGTAWQSAGKLRTKIEAALPFSLTASQRQALAEIERDLAGETRMLRLLQGDVGSGKTIVALIAMADVVEAGGQAALMAPTELLARQHFSTIAPLAEAAGIEVVLLTGGDRAAERAAQRLSGSRAAPRRSPSARTRSSRPASSFSRLGLAVVDEQHRFGVHQRHGAFRQGRGAGHAGHDGDADPAHARPFLFRRHGRLAADRKAGGAAADRHARRAALPHRRSGDADRGGHREGRQGLLGVPAGGGVGKDRPRGRRGAASPSSARLLARASASSTAA